jgi:hypothetical protein
MPKIPKVCKGKVGTVSGILQTKFRKLPGKLLVALIEVAEGSGLMPENGRRNLTPGLGYVGTLTGISGRTRFFRPTDPSFPFS